MRAFATCSLLLLLFWIIVTPQAFAASYQRTDGTIVDPILFDSTLGEAHPYSGVDLAPGVDLQGVSLHFADLRDAALSGASLHNAGLMHTRLTGADLSGATLSGSSVGGASLNRANLTGVTWVNTTVDEAFLDRSNLSYADLRGWNAQEVSAVGASFAHANLEGSFLALVAPNADFTSASLRGASFAFLDDTPTSLSGATLIGADLTGGSFSTPRGIDPSTPDYGKISLLDADFSQAVLRDVVGLGRTLGAARYNSQTDFTNAWADLDATIPFDPVTAGWTFVPEPSSAVLMGLGLLGLGIRRRR